MEKEKLVIKPSTARALKAAGLILPSCFSYYGHGDKCKVELTDERLQPFIASAYTAVELMELLPGGIEIDKNTYVVVEGHWIHLTEEALNYPCAHLHTVKTPGSCYIMAYYHFNRSIAFSKADDGKVANLLHIEESLAESLAKMVLTLLKEGKTISFV